MFLFIIDKKASVICTMDIIFIVLILFAEVSNSNFVKVWLFVHETKRQLFSLKFIIKTFLHIIYILINVTSLGLKCIFFNFRNRSAFQLDMKIL